MKEKKKRARCTPKKIRFSRPDLKIIDTDGDQITLKRVRWRIPRAKISRSPLQIFFLVIIALLIIGYFAWFGRWSFVRLAYAMVDLAISIAEYFLEVFLIDTTFLPGVINTIPDVPYIPFIPLDSDKLSGSFDRFIDLLFNAEHFASYNAGFVDLLLGIQRFLLPIVILIMVIIMKLEENATVENDGFGERSSAARRAERLLAFFGRIRDFMISLWYACPFWLLVSLILYILAGTNLLTVTVEVLANVFHLSVSLSFKSLWIQIYKLALDLTIAYMTLPWYIWCMAIYLASRYIRRKIAFDRLCKMEEKNAVFIKRLPLVVLITGKIGTGKTMTNMNLTLTMQDAMRNKMMESMLSIRAEFPFYPWECLDRQIGIMYLCGDLPSKSATRKLFTTLQATEDLSFGYTGSRIFTDGVIIKYLSDRIVDYAELQYMYRIQTLVSSTYSFRVDNTFTDKGKLPFHMTDYFHAPPFDPRGDVMRAHILDFDSLRLGKTFTRGRTGAWEFGILSHTEMGKDFGNMLTNRDLKATDSQANIKNDMLIDRIKILRHSSTACFTPYCQYIGDEQRPTSLGADALDLCDILKVVGNSKNHSVYPLLTVERFIFDLVESLWYGWYAKRSVNRADTDLYVYLLQRIMFKLYPKIEEQRQLFGYEKLRIDLMDGTDPNGTGERCEIYNCFKKTRAGRYATDCFSDILAKRSLNSSWELDLSDTYSSATATPEELRQQHSYFGAKILNIGRESDHDGTGSS